MEGCLVMLYPSGRLSRGDNSQSRLNKSNCKGIQNDVWEHSNSPPEFSYLAVPLNQTNYYESRLQFSERVNYPFCFGKKLYRKPAFREASQRFWPREIWVRTQSTSFKSVNMLNKHGGWVRSHECYLKSVLKTI